MGAIDSFLRRMGYARLDRYGLVLTPEDRVLSTRPVVLDDGLGGTIVGWADGDLAAMELQAAAPAAPAAPPARARPVAAIGRLQTGGPRVAAPVMAPVAAPVMARVAAPAVAVEPMVEEDDWEWEIAMARARAAADEVEDAAASIATSISSPPRATATIAADPMASWPPTEPLGESWADVSEPSIPHVMSPAAKDLAVRRSTPRQGLPAARPAPATTSGRSTVIPVPSLPVAARPSDLRRPATSTTSPRTRVARGTAPEETVRTHAVAPVTVPANDDQTSPYILVPPEVKPTGFAHTRRVAAKHR